MARKQTVLEIELVAIDTLTLDPENANGHPEKNLSAIRNSLTKFGQRKPVVVWRDVVVAGNGTIESMIELGWTHASVTRCPTSWTIDKARAYALADNQTGKLSEWKLPVLDSQLAALSEIGWEMSALGFDAPEPAGFDLTDPDDVPEDAPAITKSGDVWLLGRHRVMCGDATDGAAVKVLMGGGVAQCLWTDPPYGVSYVGKTKDALTIVGDKSVGLFDLLLAAFKLAVEHMDGAVPFYCAHPAGAHSVTFGNAIVASGLRIHETIIWLKNTMVLGHADYHYKHEPIFYGWTEGDGRAGRGAHKGSKWYGDNSQTSVLEFDKPSSSEEHPTMKPVALIERCLSNSTKRGDIVLDPFGGSGSTLIACENLGRSARLMELDPRYVDVICRRWESHTGIVPILESTGEEVSFNE